jgi:hypothetical protein
LNLHRTEKNAFAHALFSEVKLPNSVRFISRRASNPRALKSVLFYPCPNNFFVRGETLATASSDALILCHGVAVPNRLKRSVKAVGGAPKRLIVLHSTRKRVCNRSEKRRFRTGISKGQSCFRGASECSHDAVRFEARSSLRAIGSYAFEAGGLKGIAIAVSVEVISERAFFNCKLVETVTLVPA